MWAGVWLCFCWQSGLRQRPRLQPGFLASYRRFYRVGFGDGKAGTAAPGGTGAVGGGWTLPLPSWEGTAELLSQAGGLGGSMGPPLSVQGAACRGPGKGQAWELRKAGRGQG